MKRRDFLRKSAQALTLAAATGATGVLFHNREPKRYHAVLTKRSDFEVPTDNSLPSLAMARQADPIAALNSALNAVGRIERFVRPGEKVTIKPNVGWDRTAAQAANTNPVLVAEMVRLCLAAGAGEVIVTDVSCNDPRRCFVRSGIREAAEKAGACVILPAEEDFERYKLDGDLLTSWPVLKHFVETDRLINMPITKQHSLTRCTVGLKNLYGILGGNRSRLHQQADQSIVDLARFCRPTLTVVDCTHVLHRGGPQGGSLDDVTREDSVICSTDQVAADSLACEFLGLTGDKVGHIVLAEQAGLGTLDYRAAGFKEIV